MQLRYIFTFILFSLIFSQEEYDGHMGGYVKGQILSEDSGLPVQYAIISLLSKETGEAVNGTMTNEIGSFKIENVTPGKYDLSIESTGYDKMILPDQLIVPPNMEKDVGLLMLVPKTLILDDIEISEDKAFIEQKIDKTVYNVDALENTKGGDGSDVLEQIPSITLDIDGNVELRGDGNVTILIDGRKSNFGTNVDMLAAEMIERVEVITTPSAKYDPEGTAGIINIILRQNEYEGVSGKVGMHIGELFPEYSQWYDYGTSGTFNILKNDWNVFTNLNIKSKHRNGSSSRATTDYENVDGCLDLDEEGCNINSNCTWMEYYCFNHEEQYVLQSSEQNTSNNRYPKNANVKLGIEHYPNPSTTLAFDVTQIIHEGESTETVSIDSDDPYTTTENEEGQDLNYGFGYFKDTGDRTLSVQLDYDDHDEEEELSWLKDGYDNYEESFDEGSSEILAIDYTYVIGNSYGDNKKSQIEVGYKYSKDSDIVNQLYDLSTLMEDGTISNMNEDYRFNFNRTITSSYLTFGYYFTESFGLQFGSRLERVVREQSLENKTINTEESSVYNYNRVYPTVHFMYDMQDAGNIKFGFSRRVNRPWERALNPFRSYEDPKFANIGNKDLMPEDIYKWELGYSAMTPIGYFNTSIFSSRVTNKIDRDAQQEGDITILTWVNHGLVESWGFDLQLMTRPAKFWDLMFWGVYWHNDIIEASIFDVPGEESGFYGHIMSKFKLQNDQMVQVSTGFSTPMKITTGEIKPMFNMDVSYKKELSKKFSVTATVKDLFNTRKFEIETDEIAIFNEDDESFLALRHLEATHRRSKRRFKISFEYKFGAYKEKKYIREDGGHDREEGGGGMDMGY